MGKPQVEGYAIEWQVEPFLWGYNKPEKFVLQGISFEIFGDRIRVETIDSFLTREEFYQKVKDVLSKFIKPACVISSGQACDFKWIMSWKLINQEWIKNQVVTCEAGIKLQGRVAIFSETRNTEREQRDLLLDIISLSKDDDSLKSAIGYYDLALAGADQLVIAGNLYMAMEELILKFGGEKETADGLNVPIKKFKDDKMWLDRGRHVRRKELSPLTGERLQECKQAVREYILAYVEWLKKNSPPLTGGD